MKIILKVEDANLFRKAIALDDKQYKYQKWGVWGRRKGSGNIEMPLERKRQQNGRLRLAQVHHQMLKFESLSGFMFIQK